jgi:hypothetical protein
MYLHHLAQGCLVCKLHSICHKFPLYVKVVEKHQEQHWTQHGAL